MKFRVWLLSLLLLSLLVISSSLFVLGDKGKDKGKGDYEDWDKHDWSVESNANVVRRVLKADSVDKVVNQSGLSVFGTEYQVYDDARVFLQLVQGDSVVENSTCLLDLFYPSMSVFQGSAPMNYFVNGLYYYDLVIPNITGVYMLNVYCYYNTETNFFNSSSYNLLNGSYKSGLLSDTFESDDVDLKFKDSDDVVNVEFDFLVNTSGFNGSLQLFFEGKLKRDSDGFGELHFFLKNFSANNWFELNNFLLAQKDGQDQTINNYVLLSNISNFLSNNSVRVGLFSSNNSFKIKELEVDFLSVGFETLVGNPINDIRGGGEVHVSDYVSDLEFLLGNLSVDLNYNFSFDLVSNISNEVYLDIDYLLFNKSLNQSFLLAGGTEYYPFDNGLLWSKYFKKKGEVLVDGNCSFKMFYPNMSIFMSGFLNHSVDGFYTFDYVVPSVVGVYPVSIYCERYEGSKVKDKSMTITEVHVLKPLVTDDLILSVNNSLLSYYNDLSSAISGVSGQVSALSSSLSSHDVDIKNRLDSLELKIDLILSKLNIVTSGVNLLADVIDCLEGSVWSVEVTATDNFGNYLNNNDLSCNITTDLWGVSPLVWSGDSFDYSHVCGFGNDTINWVVDCAEI